MANPLDSLISCVRHRLYSAVSLIWAIAPQDRHSTGPIGLSAQGSDCLIKAALALASVDNNEESGVQDHGIDMLAHLIDLCCEMVFQNLQPSGGGVGSQ